MLIFGNETIVPYLDLSSTVVYNLSNANEYGIKLNNLIPPFYPMDSKDFDIFYANYIMQNDVAFKEFMYIIYNIYEGHNVYIMVGKNEYQEAITESLIKFIQQRYGYNSYLVNEPDDLQLVKDSEFSLQGVYNLDIDKERFCYLVTDFQKLFSALGIQNE